MNILNKNIDEITFNDVAEHCKSGHPEGVQLDYKEEYPAKELSKLIAAFANTRGGTIIVGVTENKVSGLPEKWSGIKVDAKLIERVHQQTLSVSPLPDYHVRFTDQLKDKAFLIIRIDEGDSTPYYVKNDANIWVKTGNIKNPISLASPEWQELLFRKRNTAEKARKNCILLAETVFNHALKKEDRDRLAIIADAKNKGDGSEKGYYQKMLGSEVEWCTLYVQPHYPRKAIANPKELMDKLRDFRHTNNFTEYPNTYHRANTIPEGIYIISHGNDGSVDCQQLYGSGLLFHRFDVLRPPPQNSDRPTVYVSHILANYIQIVMVARTMYEYFAYQGQVKTKIKLGLTRENIQIMGLGGGDPFFWENYKDVLLPEYEWNFTLDTAMLNNRISIAEKMREVIKGVSWDLGFGDIHEQRVNKFLMDQGLLDK